MRLPKSILIPLLCWPALSVLAAEEFVVRDMQVQGLQRISEGTVFNYLPINIGDQLDEKRIAEAMRALYSTGFFRDVEIRRDDGTLVVAVLERPSIENFSIDGNKDIETEDLMTSLRSAGLAEGRTFDQSVLDEVERALTDQYFAFGKYGVSIKSSVQEVPGNKVDISIDINEGDRAKIRQINIVGNENYSENELLGEFSLKTPSVMTMFGQADRYSKEALGSDLEALRSFYMDRGYANFRIESTQVTISPKKDDIFITINLEEGEKYTISDVQVAGVLPIDSSELERLILAKPGQTFNLKLLTQTAELMTYRLGGEGYAFAEVDPIPNIDAENKEVDIVFFVDPRDRVYVRRIGFQDVTSINDEVLRREMRQLEGAYLNNDAIERSKVRLQRLPYIEEVNFETMPVPGTADLVDVDFTIKEGLPGQFGGGVGFSESQKLILNGNFVHSNFLGTGKRIAVDISTSKFSTIYGFSHTDPYRTVNGVSRTFSLTYRDITQFTSASSNFSTETATAALEYGYPVSEYQSVRWGITLNSSQLLTSLTGGSLQSVQWVSNNGNPSLVEGTDIISTEFLTYEFVSGWTFDSRNRALFATRGMRQLVTFSATIPGSEVEYYSFNYNLVKYWPIRGPWIFRVHTELGFAQEFGEDTTSIPPYRNWYAGGPGTVRGYKESRLGPKDSFGNPYGGNLLLTGQAELLVPVPEAWKNSTRIAVFYDIGNVFSTGGVTFIDTDPSSPTVGEPIDYGFESFDQLKRSVGVAFDWLAPLGLFRISYAFPLNADVDNPSLFLRDETEGFQFSIGQAF